MDIQMKSSDKSSEDQQYIDDSLLDHDYNSLSELGE